MPYLGSKVLLAVAISAAIHSSAFAQVQHLEMPQGVTTIDEGVTHITGDTSYAVAVDQAQSLLVEARIGSLMLNGSALSIAQLSGEGANLTLDSLIGGDVGVDVAGSGLITLNSNADIQGETWALLAKPSTGKQLDLVMTGGRIVGDVDGIDTFEVRSFNNTKATITAENLNVKHLYVKDGTLLFQRQGTNVNGNLTVESGAGIDLQINEQTQPQYALLYVQGEAVFEQGSNINLNTPSSQFLSQDTQYILVRADELTDRGVSVNSSLSPFLVLRDINVVDSESLVATIGLVGNGNTGGTPGDNGSNPGQGPGGDTDTGGTPGDNGSNPGQGPGGDTNTGGTPGDNGNPPSGGDMNQELADLAQRLQAQGASGNGINAAQRFVSVLAGLPRGEDQSAHPIYQRFLDARDDELNELLEQLSPEASGGVFSAALSASGLTGAALSARTANVGASAGAGLSETGAWVQLLNGDANQSRRNGVAGYDADSKGLVIGADGKLNEAITLGLALSFVDTDVRGALGAKTDVQTRLLSAYGRWEEGVWGLTGSLSYGQSKSDGERAIAHEVAKGSYDSDLLAAELELGYRTQIGVVGVEPVAALRYSNVAVDSYKEKGSVAALANSSQRFEVADLGVGVNLSARLGEFAPSARLMAYHDFAQDSVKSTSSFILGGTSFVTSGADATKWTYEAGVGLDWSRGQYTLGVGYDYVRKADFNADTFSLKARYDF